ncbi:MAG: MarC family protein [Candidatus Omnitrophica bacterium]|nr:MarC family protein [Candidatus Omnitrophota bacterium]
MLITILKPYLITFIPIFLAVDIIGTIPIFLGLTESLNNRQKNKILTDSVVIATVLAVVFIFLGKLILRGLGITIDDFRVAGGILLFILSVYLLMPGKSRDFVSMSLTEDIGVFPLATPLITGPAVLVTTMMLLNSFGLLVTLTSLIVNMALAWLVLRYSNVLIRIIGSSGVKAFSKISYIFLAAIGVMIIREGIAGIISSFK